MSSKQTKAKQQSISLLNSFELTWTSAQETTFYAESVEILAALHVSIDVLDGGASNESADVKDVISAGDQVCTEVGAALVKPIWSLTCMCHTCMYRMN